MNILHLATQDKSGGGGGFDAAYRLHCSMRSNGLDSRMLVLRKASDDDDVIDVWSRLSPVGKALRRLNAIRARVMRRASRLSSYFNIDGDQTVSTRNLTDLFPFQPDAIVAHWVSGFVSARTLRDLSRLTGAPIYWYLLDMAPLTGGCHYAFGCTNYMRQCGNCPLLGARAGPRDLSRLQWQEKAESFKETNITAISASSWLALQVESASVFKNKRHETILLGLDVDVFCPASREAARVHLGLPAGRKIVFFGAQALNEERKGMRYLVEALRLLHANLSDHPLLRDQVLVVTAGNARNAWFLDVAFEHKHLGFLAGDSSLAAGYQAADIFVNASIEDSGPMMINESLLCGTPVVSFEMGVAVDLVHTDETGYRARLRDEKDMAAGLLRILQMPDEAYCAMRERCRSHGLQMCHPTVQVAAFKKLFDEPPRDNMAEH